MCKEDVCQYWIIFEETYCKQQNICRDENDCDTMLELLA